MIRIALPALLLAASVTAAPHTMDYTVTDLGGGSYDYDFTLTFDNHDGSWSVGHGYGWLIWGDIQSNSSPLTNFVGDQGDLPVGPWTGYTTSGGYHNGPTFNYVLDYWTPITIGESLVWSGTSSAFLVELDWSSIVTTGGAPTIEWEPANYGDAACDLVVELSGQPTEINRGETLSFTASGVNDCDEGKTLDEAVMEVTGPASLTQTLYDGAPITVAAGNSVSSPLSLGVPPVAPVGTYTVTVTIFRSGDAIDSDSFDIVVN